MKKTLFVFYCLLYCLPGFAQKNTNDVWKNADYAMGVFRRFLGDQNHSFPTDSSRIRFLNLFINKLAERLPQGLESVKADSLEIIITKLTTESKLELDPKNITPWSVGFEQAEFNKIKKTLSTITDSVKNAICNCMIQSLKKTYPNGLPNDMIKPVNQFAVMSECMSQLEKEGKIKPRSIKKD